MNASNQTQRCDVCGKPIGRYFQEESSSFLVVGVCCVGLTQFVHRQLSVLIQYGIGLRHPKAGEICSSDNH